MATRLHLQLPTFLQNLPLGWKCHLDEDSGKIYYHNKHCNISVWFAVQCVARRAYTEDVSLQLRSKTDSFKDKFGVDDLYFQEGDRLMLVSTEDDAWWEGELDGRVGIFPSCFVRLERCSPIMELIQETIFRDKNAIEAAKAEGREEVAKEERSATASGTARVGNAIEAMVSSMSIVQLRAMMHNYRLPWHALSVDDLREYCRYVQLPKVHHVLNIHRPPPLSTRHNVSTNGKTGVKPDSSNDADDGNIFAHGPILTESNFRRLLAESSVTPSRRSSSEVAGEGEVDEKESTESRLDISTPTSVSGSGTRLSEASAGSRISAIRRRMSINISGSPRLFSLRSAAIDDMVDGESSPGRNSMANSIATDTTPPSAELVAKRKSRALQRSQASVKTSELTIAIARAKRLIQERPDAPPSPSRLAATQRLSHGAHSVLKSVDTERTEIIKGGFLNILKTSSISSILDDNSDGSISSDQGGTSAGAKMLHTWHNRHFKLTARTLGSAHALACLALDFVLHGAQFAHCYLFV